MSLSIIFNLCLNLIFRFLWWSEWIIHHRFTFTIRRVSFLCRNSKISGSLLCLLDSYSWRRLKRVKLNSLWNWLFFSYCRYRIFRSKGFLRIKLSHQSLILGHINSFWLDHVVLSLLVLNRSFYSCFSLFYFFSLRNFFQIHFMFPCSFWFIIKHSLNPLLFCSLNFIS